MSRGRAEQGFQPPTGRAISARRTLTRVLLECVTSSLADWPAVHPVDCDCGGGPPPQTESVGIPPVIASGTKLTKLTSVQAVG
jgi:hypothetical protein